MVAAMPGCARATRFGRAVVSRGGIRVLTCCSALAATGCLYDWSRDSRVDAGKEPVETGNVPVETSKDGGLDARVATSVDAAPISPADGAPISAVDASGAVEMDLPATANPDHAPAEAGVGKDAATCDQPRLALTPALPEFMIVLDRSLSMEQAARWEPAVRGVKSATGDTDAQVAFGLTLFPPDSLQCDANAPVVSPAAKNASVIARTLDATLPNGFSPLGAALDAVADFFAKRAVALPAALTPVVVLITDGVPACAGSTDAADRPMQQAAATSAVQRLSAAGIAFHALGYQLDPDAQAFVTSLANLAGAQRYHDVQSAGQLSSELRQLALANTPCTFAVPKHVTGVATLEIAGKPIAPTGFAFATGELTLKGHTCDAYRAEVGPISVVPSCQS